MKEKKVFGNVLCVAAAFLIFFSPMLIGDIYDRRNPVTTLTGHDALVLVHGYLGCQLFQLLAIPFTSALSGFVGSLIYRAGKEEYKGKRRWSPAAVVTLAVLGSALLLIIPRVSGLDLQQKLNGCKGLPVMRIARLYNACGKDIKSGTVRRVEIVNAETGCEVFTYRKAGNSSGSYSNGYSSQYSLKSGGDAVTQISKSDSKRMEKLFMISDKHSAEIYENSGLIASFDGYDTMSFDFSTLFTLEYDGEFIRRTSLEGESLNNIMLFTEYEGEPEYQRPVGGITEFYYPKVKKGTSYYLGILYGGKPLRVSNIIEF